MLEPISSGSALLLPQQISALTVWLLGLSMGLTACTVSCLPLMGTWVLGRGQGGRAALRDTSVFILGKIAAYSMLGGLAGALGSWLTSALDSGIGHVSIGLASIVAGVWLLLPPKKHAPCGVARRGANMPPFLMGFSMSLTPCAPLASLLAVCALSGGTLAGMGYGLAFGLGAALTPLFIVLPLFGLFGKKLREGRPWLLKWTRWGAATVLLVIGLRRLAFVL